ncbi:MAG: MOSC domain-containing protein [Acidimicrobiales bacterium]
MSKPVLPGIILLEGLGVEGDVHIGSTNRQVHLIHGELHDELRGQGFDLSAGEMGENVTTRGLALLALAEGTRLHLGDTAVVELTGLRTPCRQLDGITPGLRNALAGRDADGNLAPRVGVMAVVVTAGDVRPGDPIEVEPPDPPHRPLRAI